MLGRKRPEQRPNPDAPPTTLSPETHMKGSLRFDSVLQINGTFDGEIHSAGRLLVGEDGQVSAKIQVGSAVIGGTVRGDIKATDSVEMLSTARVFGDVGTARLIVADGAVFEGELEMSGTSEERDAPATPAED